RKPPAPRRGRARSRRTSSAPRAETGRIAAARAPPAAAGAPGAPPRRHFAGTAARAPRVARGPLPPVMSRQQFVVASWSPFYGLRGARGTALYVRKRRRRREL